MRYISRWELQALCSGFQSLGEDGSAEGLSEAKAPRGLGGTHAAGGQAQPGRCKEKELVMLLPLTVTAQTALLGPAVLCYHPAHSRGTSQIQNPHSCLAESRNSNLWEVDVSSSPLSKGTKPTPQKLLHQNALWQCLSGKWGCEEPTHSQQGSCQLCLLPLLPAAQQVISMLGMQLGNMPVCMPTYMPAAKNLAWKTQPLETTGSQTSATSSVIKAVLKQSGILQHVPMLLLVDVQLLVNMCTTLILNSCLSSYAWQQAQQINTAKAK